MKTEILGPDLRQLCQNSVLTIGNFDGVHKGHRALLRESVQMARERGLIAAVLTFSPHPRAFLRPETAPVPIYDFRQEELLISNQGISLLAVQKFNTEFAQMTADAFMNSYLREAFSPRVIVVGHDFAFGKHREGSIDSLKQFCERHSIELRVVLPIRHQDELVSSTRIRKCLQTGEVELANDMLVDPYAVNGLVKKGLQLGRQIGFPTANLELDSTNLRRGVYFTRTIVNGKEHASISNVGTRPSVSNDSCLKIETYIYNFDEEIYGKEVQIQFLHFQREEKKFSSVEELKQAIHNDVIAGAEYHRIDR
ncbi:MAG TPA: riboflavin biosynthesis protein RibF [Pseudobdellovibrionaceae bacterium]|nr:riboflavin biosynthesis protein RibF [Pseudobdellovibrionaceae bacterium]